VLVLLVGLACAWRATGEGVPMSTTNAAAGAAGTEKALFGAGCFWCTEAAFQGIEGVKSVTSGYAGGTVRNPTYKQVCTGTTGHAEVTRLEYDPAKVSYEKLLETFWHLHDPTTPDRQGNDVGTQYRSVIFTFNDAQKRAAEASKAAVQKQLERPIVTQIVPAPEFYPAEDYHQDYYNRNREAPFCRLVIQPKLKKLGLER
jgi:peptide-methionine (S)-S-oxide reductase